MTDDRKSRRKPLEERRYLNSEESYAMGWAELQENADEDGWPYPDDDDGYTTEDWLDGAREKG